MKRIAIVGGGPGGLFTARQLAESCGKLARITLIEADSRLGGKIRTERFSSASVIYEAGLAELYDYPHSGDPVRSLVDALRLKTVPVKGETVILGKAILATPADIRAKLGDAAADALDGFHAHCSEQCSPEDYADTDWRAENVHPLAAKTFAEELDAIGDERARRFVETAVHTDIATAPHATSALNGVKNVLMEDDRYLAMYAIEGGNARLVEQLAAATTAEICLGTRVTSVGRMRDGGYRLLLRCDGRDELAYFDFVVLALPNYWLQAIDFEGGDLRRSIGRHLAQHDHPAHYLRVSGLFRSPFWRERIQGSFWMQDVFGGTCLYDESDRTSDAGGHGVLGWLLAGEEAMALANMPDDTIVSRVLDSLPACLADGREQLIEARVHRWIGSVNALPGGHPVKELRERHQPAPDSHPGIVLVGDYLFDSTLNGAYHSADFAAGIVATEVRKAHYALPEDELTPSAANDGALGAGYHDEYAGDKSYEESFEEYFCEHYTASLIKTVWGREAPYKLLDVGSATGITLELFDRLGIEAWGIENSAHIHARTLPAWRHRNFLGDVRALPFADGEFDFVYDTCLCYLPDEDLDTAIIELFRVCRTGVFFGGITSDMTREVIERHELFRGVQSLMTTWEWSERFLRQGFRLAIADPEVLRRTWSIECASNEGDFPWYPGMSTMRHCFYTKPAALAESRRLAHARSQQPEEPFSRSRTSMFAAGS